MHVKRLRTDKGGKYYNPGYFQTNGFIDEATAGYTPQLNDVAQRNNRILQEMILSMPRNKRKKLGEKGLESIFVGYAKFSKIYRFYIIDSNDFIPVHTIIDSRNAIFNEVPFSSIIKPKDLHLINPKEIDLNNKLSPQDDHVIIEDEEEYFPILHRVKGKEKKNLLDLILRFD